MVGDMDAADIWIPTPEELAARAESSASAKKPAPGGRRRPVRGQMRVRRSATGTSDTKPGEPSER